MNSPYLGAGKKFCGTNSAEDLPFQRCNALANPFSAFGNQHFMYFGIRVTRMFWIGDRMYYSEAPKRLTSIF